MGGWVGKGRTFFFGPAFASFLEHEGDGREHVFGQGSEEGEGVGGERVGEGEGVGVEEDALEACFLIGNGCGRVVGGWWVGGRGGWLGGWFDGVVMGREVGGWVGGWKAYRACGGFGSCFGTQASSTCRRPAPGGLERGGWVGGWVSR